MHQFAEIGAVSGDVMLSRDSGSPRKRAILLRARTKKNGFQSFLVLYTVTEIIDGGENHKIGFPANRSVSTVGK